MTTTAKKTAKKNRSKKSAILPPSADVAKIAGRDFVIMPLDDFEEWQEDLALATLVEERLKDGDPYITLEELKARLGKKNKGRVK